jgi:hypothetical protein
MKSFTKLLMMLVLMAGSAFAQTSALTATITDPDGQTWNNGTYTINFVPAPNTLQPSTWTGGTLVTQFKGSLNGSGVLSLSVADNAFVSPPGSQWQFTLCPNSSAPCQNVKTIVTGASPSLSTTLSNGLIAPRFSAGPNAYGYLNVEVNTPVVPGATYYNVTSGATQTWSGSAWTSSSGGSGTVGSCAAAGDAYYAASGTTTACDTSITDSGGGTLTIGGTATITTPTNTALNLTPNGTGPVVVNVGTVTAPTAQATGSASNTGTVWTTSGFSWDNAGTLSATLEASGTEVGGSASFLFGSGNGSTSTQALDISTSVLNGNTISFDTTSRQNESALLRSGLPCRVTSAVTLSGTTAVICTWSLPAVAKTWAYQCQGTYNITAGTTPALTLQMNASQTPTSETGEAMIGTVSASGTTTQIFNTGANTATASGVQTIFADALATITTLTSAPWQASGTVQASATAGTFAIQAVLSGTGTPAGTISVGSTCLLY